ncbi:hypothetical protein [Halomonas citrativorans]|uniref:Sulfatase-modifying factor enzyme domain-containing protein n=1 Tax=Halomonas citrativorans TaxID=2742612 RepID=A0ABR9F9C6_9GAMM|nr:hypothetical protein [Halomonas citrativorans]MBE0403065.1 hypothetical protein [Halomonas citrativorans]
MTDFTALPIPTVEFNPAAFAGSDGREIELQVNATHIQWHYVGDTAWLDLVALDTLKGTGGSGGEIELQSTATHIQWRYVGVGDDTWTDLIALSSLEPSKLGEGAIKQVRSTFQIYVPDPLRRSVESASGGKCTVEYTVNQQPCFMHVFPKLYWEDLLPWWEMGEGVHEAFIANGVEKSELLIGMYMAAEVNGEMVSQPRTVGRRSISLDQSVEAAQASGFQLFGNWEWSAVALWCMTNGFQPRGNTDYGKSHSHTHERGTDDSDGYTLLGSGPNTWSHNNSPNGIADLVGSRQEWVRGFKMVDGRILLAPDNDAELAESAWVDTGWDMSDAGVWAGIDNEQAPESVKRALIVPNGIADPEGRLYRSLSGERFPCRGGARNSAGNAGLGALSLTSPRTYSYTDTGLRLSRLV